MSSKVYIYIDIYTPFIVNITGITSVISFDQVLFNNIRNLLDFLKKLD